MPGPGDPWTLGPLTVRNRITFGPHVTNLADGRAVSDRHVAYYRRRAAGGAGLIVIETASVHPGDWPYERAPLALQCGSGWAATAAAVHAEGAKAVASLGHTGGQGSSAYSQAALWAPSDVPDPLSREVPKAMEEDDIEAVVTGFAEAALGAARSGLDGVEVDAGALSLLRQYLSPLTNQRTDGYGQERSLILRRVLEAVRAAAPGLAVLLRLSVDEAAGAEGIDGPAATAIAFGVAGLVHAVTVVAGGPWSTAMIRPDAHTPQGFNRAAAAALRRALPAAVAVVAQGSIADVDVAGEILAAGQADAIEMTRAQIADPDLAGHWLAGRPDRIRPCLLCNQTCLVQGPANYPVGCVVEPTAGHETEARDLPPPVVSDRPVLVVGAGPAGLEAARTAALAGRQVTVVETQTEVGGMVAVAARGVGRDRLARLTEWLRAELARLGVTVETDRFADAAALADHPGPVIVCTGSRPAPTGPPTIPADTVLVHPPETGPVVVWDPLGGPIGVSVAETLAAAGAAVTVVTPDPVAGERLAVTGDLAGAQRRLLTAGVGVVADHRLVAVRRGVATIEDVDTGARRRIPAAVVVDAGPRWPEDHLRAHGVPAGDCVAPRTIAEAVREGRRAGQTVGR